MLTRQYFFGIRGKGYSCSYFWQAARLISDSCLINTSFQVKQVFGNSTDIPVVVIGWKVAFYGQVDGAWFGIDKLAIGS